MCTSTPTWTCACRLISASRPATPPPQITTLFDVTPGMEATLVPDAAHGSREKPLTAEENYVTGTEHRPRRIAHHLPADASQRRRAAAPPAPHDEQRGARLSDGAQDHIA